MAVLQVAVKLTNNHRTFEMKCRFDIGLSLSRESGPGFNFFSRGLMTAYLKDGAV